MALNASVFKTRSLSAVVFVIVMLAGLLLNQWLFLLLILIIHTGCWLEFEKLICLRDETYNQRITFHRYGVICIGIAFILWLTNNTYTILDVRISEIGWWLMLMLILALPLTELLFSRHFNIKNMGYSLGGLVYISISLALFADMSDPELNRNFFYFSSTGYNPELPLLIILSLWINDTMAYIVGSLIGKTPFSKISPKKTWEGTVGGALLAVVTIFVTAFFLAGSTVNSAVVHCAVIAAIAAVAGTAGDLFESKLKRIAGVKDSGTMMPGHGGFLDRFDSLLFAAPAVWLYVVLFV